jgi:hypothetical protein
MHWVNYVLRLSVELTSSIEKRIYFSLTLIHMLKYFFKFTSRHFSTGVADTKKQTNSVLQLHVQVLFIVTSRHLLIGVADTEKRTNSVLYE